MVKEDAAKSSQEELGDSLRERGKGRGRKAPGTSDSKKSKETLTPSGGAISRKELQTPLETGLTKEQADERFKKYGCNCLPEEKPPSSLAIFLAQFKSPLVYILLAAAAVTVALGEYTDALVISFAVFINTILGFVQEERAGKALEALKKLVHPQVRVIRDGEVLTIALEEVVPGDIVLLRQGDKVPADGEFVEVNRLFVEEAILTGESVPVDKAKGQKGFMGTMVTAGTGKLLVTATGEYTEMGKIALSVSTEKEKTPLSRQLNKFSKQLTFLVLGLTVLVFVVGMLLGNDLTEIFTTSVALAVSSIPEGLLVGLTVVLAIGMQRILARKGLVRNLASAETLGGVTTICVDKTGTLTEGKMKVVGMIGDQKELAMQSILANDLDDPVVIAAWEWGSQLVDSAKDISRNFSRLDSIPFSSDYQYFASLNKWHDDSKVVFMNGAPEVVMEKCDLDSDEKEKLMTRLDEMTSEGKRIIGMARKVVSSAKEELSDADTSGGFEWVGLLAFTDPVRADVKDSLAKTSKAGIRLIVITGDYAKTALSVMEELDLAVKDEHVITGAELWEMSEEALLDLISKSAPGTPLLFARTKPDQKLKIVEVLKRNNEIVAMMGDGVNDAPAVSKADIGIVVGEASDVSKESADLVLLDSSFSTIVAAIEEGRGIFDNIRKIILYLMCDAFSGIVLVLTTTLFKFPLPIKPIQILWINVISDGFPNLALTLDPKTKGIMERPPRSPNENLVVSWIYMLIGLVSLTGGAFTLLLYWVTLKTTGDLTLARSVVFANVGLDSLVYVFSVRTLTLPFWKEKIFGNTWLIGAVALGMVFQLVPYTPLLRDIFGLVPIGGRWLWVGGASALMFVLIELSKWLFRSQLHSRRVESLAG
ncbi:HAD-IC family P-type ATPase [candidate division WWE3 bacterium]|nr:HAD-IC family P-type ATPase [candidate division WWE3 bacterium]